ncbi:MAG TPA: CHAT domain-containing protein, partial [Gemmatimonadaceae bacterium]
TLQVARLLLDAGHADSALAETQRIDSIVSALNLPREAIRARVIRGTALVRLGEVDAGVRTLDGALATAERHPSPDILVEAHEALGEAFAATGRDDSALHEFDLAALAVEHSTLDLTLDLDRAGYRDRNLRPYDGALRLLLRASSRPGATDELVRWLSRRNAAALALGAGGSAAARSRGPAVPGLDDLRSRLRDDEVLLAYVVLDSTVSGVAVTRSGARAARLPIDAPGLAARIDAIRRPLVTTFSGRLDLARAHYAAGPAAELYAALIEPFVHEIAGKRRLLIAPDGALHALSFDGLVAPDGAYLIDAFETEYLPSPAFLPAPEERQRAQRLNALRLLAVGYGAPGSEAEVRALRDVWPHGRIVVLDSSGATTSAVKKRMTAFGILHFAVHATADTHDPLMSHLTLVADSLDDGLFHTADIAAARTNAALVVLSACETDAGPIFGGEGAMGIARAFLAGGARAVVATQWPVGAETATLMREFYARLARGEAPATALRAAKLMMRRSAGGGHPVYWAGFELVR